MINQPNRGSCRKEFPLSPLVLGFFGSPEAFSAAYKAGHQYSLHPIGMQVSAEVEKACDGCIFKRPDLEIDNPDRAHPNTPAVQIHLQTDLLTTHMSSTHMMSPSCLQKGEKIADPPLLDIE